MNYVSLIPNEVACDPDTSSRLMKFLRLPHPRTGVPCLFLPRSIDSSKSPAGTSNAIFEVQAVAPHSCRSWFLDDGHVVADGNLLAMTPMDPVFLLLPILQAAQPIDSVGIFRTSDHIFEDAATRLSVGDEALNTAPIKNLDVMELARLDCVPDALRRMCDVKDLTEDLSAYRFSRAVLLATLRAKIARISEAETFDSFPSLRLGLARDGLMDEGKEALRQAGRTRSSCEVLSQYLPPDIAKELIASYDFTDLDAYMHALKLEDNAQATAPSLATVRQQETDKKRKATSQQSRGVSKLMKVNTNGMAKISSFFKKPTKSQ